MKIIVALACLISTAAVAQGMPPMRQVPLPANPDQVCKGIAESFAFAARGGEVLNRNAQVADYALPSRRILADVAIIERIHTLQIREFEGMPGVNALIACHARLTERNGKVTNGVYTLQQLRGVSVWTWAAD